MAKALSILIIENHPLIANAFKSAFKQVQTNNKNLKFNIDIAVDCDSSILKITTAAKKNKDIALVFLDIKLPPSKDRKFLNGEDLGILIRKLLPNTKIIVATTFNDNYRMYSIFQSISPEGFLVKDDISSDELIAAIETVLDGNSYFSKTVSGLLRKNISHNYILDNVDRRLLYEISIGTKQNQLPKIFGISNSNIENRKRNLKNIFNIDSSDNSVLLAIAREKGFL